MNIKCLLFHTSEDVDGFKIKGEDSLDRLGLTLLSKIACLDIMSSLSRFKYA